MSKIAVVTGTSGQLGPVWVETLMGMGFTVFGIDLPKYDVGDENQVKAAKEECVRFYGVPDVLVLNAGIDATPGTVADFWSDDRKIVGVNLHGAAYVVKAFYKEMVERKRGSIVFIGSMLGFVAADYRNYTPPFDKPWAYGASKAGMWNLCKNLAVRLAPHGIACNMLALSGVRGKQYGEFIEKYSKKIPIGRMLEPEDFVPFFKACVTATVPCDFPVFVGGGFTIW